MGIVAIAERKAWSVVLLMVLGPPHTRTQSLHIHPLISDPTLT